jgi:hypothetical protein
MLHPSSWSPDYSKNMRKLQDEGYHHAKHDELPEYLQGLCGAETFLVNDAGAIKSVGQTDGTIRDVSRTRPERWPRGLPSGR